MPGDGSPSPMEVPVESVNLYSKHEFSYLTTRPLCGCWHKKKKLDVLFSILIHDQQHRFFLSCSCSSTSWSASWVWHHPRSPMCRTKAVLKTFSHACLHLNWRMFVPEDRGWSKSQEAFPLCRSVVSPSSGSKWLYSPAPSITVR